MGASFGNMITAPLADDYSAAGGVLHPVVGMALGIPGDGAVESGFGWPVMVGLTHEGAAPGPFARGARAYRGVAHHQQHGPEAGHAPVVLLSRNS